MGKSKGRDVQDKGQGEGIMYVDDRLGRRSRARSGLDQLDVAEDLLAEVAAAVAVCALGPKRRRPEVSS